jgi:hypothetical protein
VRFLVRKLDDWICRSAGIYEFSRDPDCLFRLQVTRAPHPLHLPDLELEPGDPVLLLHLWNERLPPFSSGAADLAWARQFLRLFKHSLSLVAECMAAEPELSKARAVGGETILLTSGLHESGKRFVQDLGFTVIPCQRRLGRFGEFWENAYSWMIIWTFNPDGLPGKSILEMSRSEMWLGREAFLQRYKKAC